VLVQIAQDDAPKLMDIAAHVPIPISVIVSRMMARRREERYQEVGVVLEDLASYERRGLLKAAARHRLLPAPRRRREGSSRGDTRLSAGAG